MTQAGVDAQAAALAARLVPQVPRLARLVVERIRAEVPGFDRLPSEVQDVEVAATARAAIRAFLEHAQGLPGRDTGLSRRRAVQRAEEGVPLAALVQTYSVGAEVVVDALAEAAAPGEEAALLRLTREQLRAVGVAVSQVTEAYLTGAGGQHVAVRELTWALLRGEGPEDVAAHYGLPLESGYLVLRVRGTGDADPSTARAGLRWVLGHLAPRADGRALSLRDDLGGLRAAAARVPARGIGAPVPRRGRGRTGGRGRVGVLAGGGAGGRDAGRPDQHRRRPGVHRLSDVLLEYHLTHPVYSAADLVAVLAPLSGQRELLPTLVAFLDADLNRRGAAGVLGVHANTVDNRLDRTAELTGVDPRSSRGIQLFGAALVVHRAFGRARLAGVPGPGA